MRLFIKSRLVYQQKEAVPNETASFFTCILKFILSLVETRLEVHHNLLLTVDC